MVEGFWIVWAQGPQGKAGGVAVFTNGKIFGGDSAFSYIGTYREDGKVAKARVLVHNFDPAIKSVLDIPGDYELQVSVNIDGDKMTGTAMVANQPHLSLGIWLEKKANL